MGIFSSSAAAVHNDELQVKAAELVEAIKKHDWKKVKSIQMWLNSRPFDEY